jgi:hypothetical protein
MTADIELRPNDLFDGPGAVDKFEALKEKMVKKGVLTDTLAARGEIGFEKKEGTVLKGEAARNELLVKAGVTPDLIKEWTTSAPIASTAIATAALTPYDYEQEVLWLVPNDTPIRNTVAREKGVGEGTEYRRLTGLSNSRTAGAANLSPFFVTEGTANVTNNVNLNRASIMAEVGDKTWKPYVEMGLQSQVSMKYQFAAQGYADIRALSHLSLLRSGWFAEENALLNSTSVATSIAGLSATAAASGTNTGSGAVTSGAVVFTLSSAWGESQSVSAGTVTLTAGQGIALTITGTIPAGVTAINTYYTASGPVYYKGTTVLTNGTTPTTFAVVAALPSSSADNGSYPNYVFGGTLISNASSGSVVGYDGMISNFSGANAGYTKSLNAALSTTSVFSELETAFQTLAQGNAARPDKIITTYSIRGAFWDMLKNGNSGATNFRANFALGQDGTIAGGAVASIVNQATGDVIEIVGHRFSPAGTIVIHSTKVPWADSNVNATIKVKSVVDNMVLDFPQVGMTYDAQTYFFGTALFQAPVLSGTLLNVLN